MDSVCPGKLQERYQASSQASWSGGKEIDGFFRLTRREEAAWRAMQRRATQSGGKRRDLFPSIQLD
jgi:hypothetical protein